MKQHLFFHIPDFWRNNYLKVNKNYKKYNIVLNLINALEKFI